MTGEAANGAPGGAFPFKSAWDPEEVNSSVAHLATLFTGSPLLLREDIFTPPDDLLSKTFGFEFAVLSLWRVRAL